MDKKVYFLSKIHPGSTIAEPGVENVGVVLVVNALRQNFGNMKHNVENLYLGYSCSQMLLLGLVFQK